MWVEKKKLPETKASKQASTQHSGAWKFTPGIAPDNCVVQKCLIPAWFKTLYFAESCNLALIVFLLIFQLELLRPETRT